MASWWRAGRVVGQAKRFSKEIGTGVKRCADVVEQLALQAQRQPERVNDFDPAFGLI
jgi:hypothetical protein